MKQKVIFIINAIQNQRCIKRVREFIEEGFEVNVYAFSRSEDIYNDNIDLPFEIIGTFSNSLTYRERLPIIYKAISRLKKKYHEEDVLFYLFGLDIALIYSMGSCRSKYIYEESDLVHTYYKNTIIKKAFEIVDKWIIRKSFMTVFTSEGFSIYHFGNTRPHNCWIITNRLNSSIKSVKAVEKVQRDNLSIGFVGMLRFESVISFIDVYCARYPQNEFHLYGNANTGTDENKKRFEELKKYPNCHFHGVFRNPTDLPSIYSNIDLVLSTYDVTCDNVRYAEPNKLYESIYFETPIIVSSNTFLAQRVKELGIGFDIDAKNTQCIIDFLENLTTDSIREKQRNAQAIGKQYAINKNDEFFKVLKQKIAKTHQ